MDSVLIAPGVALVDISASLPRHETLRYRIRVNEPEVLIVHHTGADNGLDGEAAWQATARYHIAPRTAAPQGWPGIAYHYGICRRGAPCLYRFASEPTIRYHSGSRANRRGSALVLQGHLGQDPLTSGQEVALGAALGWWLSEHPGSVIGWHAIASRWGGRDKRACPGRYAVEWLRTWLTARGLPDPAHLV